GRVVGQDREGGLGDREVGRCADDELVVGGGQVAGGAGHDSGVGADVLGVAADRAGRVAGGRVALVVGVLEAAQVVGRGRVCVAVDLGRVVGQDREGGLGDREVGRCADDELVVGGGQVAGG